MIVNLAIVAVSIAVEVLVLRDCVMHRSEANLSNPNTNSAPALQRLADASAVNVLAAFAIAADLLLTGLGQFLILEGVPSILDYLVWLSGLVVIDFVISLTPDWPPLQVQPTSISTDRIGIAFLFLSFTLAWVGVERNFGR